MSMPDLWTALPWGDHLGSAHRYVVADVFTDTPLEGNQLGVFTDARGLCSGWRAR
jgi:hypothetical protein